MNQIKTRMMELDETKRISKELIKIFQEHEHQNHEKYRQNVYQYRSVNSNLSNRNYFLFLDNFTSSTTNLSSIVDFIKFYISTTTVSKS